MSGGTECRAAAGACDVAEQCTGAAPGCPADAFEPPTTECRAAVGVCDASELCTGSDPTCPADGVFDGVPCPDGDVCNGDEMCVAGTCTAGGALSCDDNDPCTADSCDQVSGCYNDPIPQCGAAPVPMASGWGVLLLSLLVITTGALFANANLRRSSS